MTPRRPKRPAESIQHFFVGFRAFRNAARRNFEDAPEMPAPPRAASVEPVGKRTGSERDPYRLPRGTGVWDVSRLGSTKYSEAILNILIQNDCPRNKTSAYLQE
jgi:hypothetical protein